jgi:protocatechuate 3,4-dioxygenase beta subunit
MIGAVGAAARAAGCSADGSSPTTPSAAAGGSTNAACAVTPSETAGPFPSKADFVRSDIREGKNGVMLTLTIAVVNANADCAPAAGLAVEIWQCDVEGNYSQYGSQTAETYLRGIQTTDGSGQVSFTTVYPGWYQGRATHIHVDVSRSNGALLKTTQIAFPESVNAAVYASGVYASRGQNPTPNTRDGIFADSLDSELATISGSPSAGYLATFRVAAAL